MAKTLLTDKMIQRMSAAKHRGNANAIMDAAAPGLGVKVAADGSRVFILSGFFPGSKNPTRRDIGTYGAPPLLSLEAARRKAARWRALMKAGVDPRDEERRVRLEHQRRREETLSSVVEAFLADPRVQKQRQRRAVERALRGQYLPSLGDRPVTEISKRDVLSIIASIQNRGTPYYARNVWQAGRSLFNWARDTERFGLETSPFDGLRARRILGPSKARDRTLEDHELAALWRAAGRLGYPYGPIFRLLALTACRKSEIAEARWREIDLGQKILVIPPNRYKSDRAHVVPLTDDAIDILKTLPRRKKTDLLFCFLDDEIDDGAPDLIPRLPVNSFNKAKAKLDRHMRLILKAAVRKGFIEPEKAELPGFVIHDIRRTVRTRLSEFPTVSTTVAELVIGHTQKGLHAVYDKYSYVDEKRKALGHWAAKLRSIVHSSPTNVVRLGSATKNHKA